MFIARIESKSYLYCAVIDLKFNFYEQKISFNHFYHHKPLAVALKMHLRYILKILTEIKFLNFTMMLYVNNTAYSI